MDVALSVPVGFDLRLTRETMAWLAAKAIDHDLNNMGEAAPTYSISQAFTACFHDPDLITEMFEVGLLSGYAVSPLWEELPTTAADTEFAPYVAAALAQIGNDDG